MSHSLGKVALVTGGASGLGRALSLELARRGLTVVVADLNLEGAEATARSCREAGVEALAVVLDVADADAFEKLAVDLDARFGGVDFVANNAGVAVGGLVGEVPLADWRWLVGVNLWGVVHGCHVFLPRMRARGHGRVLNVASAAGLVSSPMLGPYNVSKAAVVALSETLAAELHGTDVGVTVLCPTFFETNIARSARNHGETPTAKIDALMKRSKLQAEGVAKAALDGCAAGKLFVVPHADGRLFWRLKRAMPEAFAKRLVPMASKKVAKG